jgi:O-antigen/teichoic acid export membrane protein
MLKRIAIIAFFTGSGQLLSIFVLKYLSQHSSVSQLKAIAEIDSLVFFIMSLIALGLQPAAMRNLALTSDWEPEYVQTQNARITLGILLMGIAALAFVNVYYLIFLMAPILAWNGDYALYARGYAITGSVIAFLRLLVPFSVLFFAAMYFQTSLAWVYAIALAVLYVLTNMYISFFLKAPFSFRPSFKSLHLYVSSFPLGIAAVSLYILGLGLVLVIPYFYSVAIVTTAFVGLKFYMIFKGVVRIVHQAFLKEMQSRTISLKVDQLSTIAGVILFGSVLVFPDSFITFFFSSKYLDERNFFTLLGLNGLIYSVFLSFGTRAVYQKADKKYTILTASAAVIAIIAVIALSAVNDAGLSIAIGLGIGELIWATGLVIFWGERKDVQDRLAFLAAVLPLLLIPLAFRLWLGDRLLYYFISFGLLGLVILLLHNRKFRKFA